MELKVVMLSGSSVHAAVKTVTTYPGPPCRVPAWPPNQSLISTVQ